MVYTKQGEGRKEADDSPDQATKAAGIGRLMRRSRRADVAVFEDLSQVRPRYDYGIGGGSSVTVAPSQLIVTYR